MVRPGRSGLGMPTGEGGVPPTWLGLAFALARTVVAISPGLRSPRPDSLLYAWRGVRCLWKRGGRGKKIVYIIIIIKLRERVFSEPRARGRYARKKRES